MRLGLNIDHIATIREARKAREPEPVAAAVIAELAGAEGITVHLRGDRRTSRTATSTAAPGDCHAPEHRDGGDA